MKKLSRDFPDNFFFRIHSEEFKDEFENFGDVLNKSWITNFPPDVVILPLFTEIKGLYLLDTLFNSGALDDFLVIQVNNLLINYIPHESGVLTVEFSIKRLFDKYSPASPVYLYFLLEGQLPLSFMNNTPVGNIIKKTTISRYKLLTRIISDILSKKTIEAEITILHEINDKATVEEIKRALNKKFYLRRFFPGINNIFNSGLKHEDIYLQAVYKFLSDLSRG